jgi:hypothetical protein
MRVQHPLPSALRMFLFSLAASGCVLGASLAIQWLVYEDWLHQTGPLHLVGTSIAAALTFVFVLRWEYAVREHEREMVRRLEKILQMNDRIRNALQAIECVTYLSEPQATAAVRQSVEVIDAVLREVLEDAGRLPVPMRPARGQQTDVKGKSA